ncbi:2-hydroxyacyl-CoA dehydratase [Novosphingobium piscinae]|uniref:2-hydroxyacyl-CoA dehydratase n=1 Tax=Novosphingobium piscinae TaxID=1507448 RepID=A0A7X1FV62_9SPHN|nr:2-hydroxyacyl-CoA dehydratase family protein [Novosphingobium piscinae]MBC2667566.1 2-hydroxyacyl-CoA dehydratase [Novosphingobium piscinae]
MLEPFRRAYADPAAEVARALAAGRRPLRTLGVDAPRERLIAAGFQPIRLVAPPLPATPRADAVMGAAELGPRGRRLLETLLTLDHPDVPVLITQADGDQPQIFAALRELGRLGEGVPRHVHFLDRLHLDRPASRAYTAVRLDELDAWLAGLGGPASADHTGPAPALAPLLGRIDGLRRAGRISGCDALVIAGACAVLPAAEAEGALTALLAADLPARPSGTPVLVCGTAHEDDRLYRAIEAAGCTIVGEVHGWGLTRLAAPARVTAPAATAAQVAVAAAQLRPALVLHLAIDGDEAAPWDVAAIRRALPADCAFAAMRCASAPDAGFAAALAAALGPGPGAPVAAASPAPKPPASPRPAPARSRKVLRSTADVNAWQRDWFASVREAVAAGAPFAVVNANAPQEILRALDVPFVVNQWWASIVAAKQQSRRYQDLLRAHDLPADVEAYSAQGLAALFDDVADLAPWGGLPRPDFVHAVASSDPTLKLFTEWGEASGADCFIYERTIDPRPDLYVDWWQQLPDHWETAVESARIDLLVTEMREVITRIESRTGRRFDPARLAEVMALVNEQEDYYRKTRDLVARTVPAPIGVVDSMPATMVPQWHRGTVWARDAAKAFYEEVCARAEAGLGACPAERIRLMWVGRGLWSEMGFYQKWEDSHGAVFVWSMYLALAADGYIRDLSRGQDPLRALASRIVCMGDELRMPTWAGPWHVHEARTHQIDAAVALQDADPFVVRALRAAGIPVLELTADNFNREDEDAAAIEAAITAFIEGPARERAARRCGG